MLVGVDASRVTRAQRTGTENYSLNVLRELLADDERNAYRLYLSQPLPDGLLPLRPRTTTRLIRLPRLWTQVGLSTEILVSPRQASGDTEGGIIPHDELEPPTNRVSHDQGLL